MLHVDQSVWSTQIVPPTKHVETTNVLTPALEPVEEMHCVKSEIIILLAHALKDTLGTHSLHVEDLLCVSLAFVKVLVCTIP